MPMVAGSDGNGLGEDDGHARRDMFTFMGMWVD